jgi:hypothetical protein
MDLFARLFSSETVMARTIWIVDTHRDDGRRFVVPADDRLTAFLELERAVCLQLLTERIKS